MLITNANIIIIIVHITRTYVIYSFLRDGFFRYIVITTICIMIATVIIIIISILLLLLIITITIFIIAN